MITMLGNDPPKHSVPVAAVKNYIRRAMYESDVSCPFVFSAVDRGSCVMHKADGSKLIVIGLRDLYEKSKAEFVGFGAEVPNGLPKNGLCDGMRIENPVSFGVCAFAREDDAVWVIRSSFHELEHLREECVHYPVLEAESLSDDVRTAVDAMLSSCIGEYYAGSYHVMTHEMHAEYYGITNALLDLNDHCDELGLTYDRCRALMLDKLCREPHWYGELFGPDESLPEIMLSMDHARKRVGKKDWPDRPLVRMFDTVDDAVATLSQTDFVERLTGGWCRDVRRDPDGLYCKLSRVEIQGLSFASTRDEARVYLMKLMVSHGMLDRFSDEYVAGFDMWPQEAQEAYLLRHGDAYPEKNLEQRENNTVCLDESVQSDAALKQRALYVQWAEGVAPNAVKAAEELPERKRGDPLILGWG